MSAAVIPYICPMGRWAPAPRARLEQEALALYTERGYASTTVAEIAERAGLTERTFFRHFTDKREVLFAGETQLRELFLASVADAPSEPALEIIAFALKGVAADFEQRADLVLQREAVIAANPELRERELTKLAALAPAIAGALRGRGLDRPGAALAGEIAVALFKNAFEQWVQGGPGASFTAVVDECVLSLQSLVEQPTGNKADGREQKAAKRAGRVRKRVEPLGT